MKLLLHFYLLLALFITASCSTSYPPNPSQSPHVMKPNVLLIHGVLMNSLEMHYLGKQLKNAGFNVYYTSYPSVGKTSAENAVIVHQKIKQLNVPNLHIVAHSLGGLVTLHLFDQFDDIPQGRVVMIGSPVNGSLIAKRVKHWFIVSSLLAKSMTSALSGENIPTWKGKRDWGMISGSKNRGVATLVGGLPKASDGTVMIEETMHPKLTDQVTIKATHTGMLFSKKAAGLVIGFLNRGTFAPQ